MAAYVKTLQDASRENIIYPRTKSEAVYRDDNTTSVEDTLVTLESEVASILENTNDLSGIYETKSDAASKLTEAKGYADSIKNDLLNGAGSAYDTLKELGELIDDNTDAIDALNTVAASKADASELASHTSDTIIHITSAERTAWNNKEAGGTAASAVNSHNTDTSAHSDIRSAINTHTLNTNNPHGVTAAQVGAPTVAEMNATIEAAIGAAIGGSY